MNCASLPDTGGPAAVWLIMGLACVVGGWLLVRRGGTARRHGLSSVVLVVVAAACLVAQPSPGQAAEDCTLVIEQTSVITGLAPSVAPAAITGVVINPSHDSTYVTDVTVRVTSVTQDVRRRAGQCTASDYVLLDARMPVNRPLPELSSVRFSGASIGLKNTSRNQDACKRATVHLGYVSGSR